MPSSRSTNNPSSSSSRPSASSTRPTRAPPLSSSSASTATTSSRYSQQAPPLRQPTNTLLTTVQQHASIPPSQFPPTPASVYGGSGSSHTHLAGSIDQVFAQSQQQSQFTSPAVPPQQVIQQHNVPQVPPTSFHHPTHTDRMEYAERERIAQAGRVLGSREMLMRYAVLNNESIPQTRLRFQKQLVGIKHVPYQPPATSSSKASSSKGGNGGGGVIRDMRPDEDTDDHGTWADGEIVVGAGPLVPPESRGAGAAAPASSDP